MRLFVSLSLCILNIGHVTLGVHVNRNNVYGCYVDQWARTLNGGLTRSNSMTVGKCAARCRRENKRFYGLEVGVECFTGNELTRSNKRSLGDCKMACKGNRKEACGNHWRVLIYRNPHYRSILVKSGYQGCYQDQRSRTLNGKMQSSSRMTVDMCRNFCTRHNTMYYGVENGNECWCGDSLRRRVKKSDNDCLKQCRGNRNQGCGGPWRVAVYRNYNYKRTAVQTSGLVGCYRDQRDRVLKGSRTSSSSMTLARCRSRAQREKKKYFGMQVGHECFVGDFMKYNHKRPTSECLMPCKGNRAEGCGGHWRIVIYKNHRYRSNLVKTGFVGCYQDQWARTLKRKKSSSSRMTFEKCRSICSHKKVNSKYFGMENGNECHCGDHLTRKVLKNEGECTKKCNGNHRQGCGGPWRIIIYRNSNYKKTRVLTGGLMGCYKDQRDRVLKGSRTSSSSMTLARCRSRAERENKKYFGMQVGHECFVGDFMKYNKKRPTSECMMPCRGNYAQGCGGHWRIVIYKNHKFRSNLVKTGFVGCYQDQWARTLKRKKSSSSRMTFEKCRSICSHKKVNSKYFGMENGNECHCGDHLTRKVLKNEGECTKKCNGNHRQGCGGPWRITIYRNSNYKKTHVLKGGLVGCYKDQRDRVLRGSRTSSSSMDLAKCRSRAQRENAKYFGMQVGHECFVGDFMKFKNKRPTSECMMPCRGNYAQGCGGQWRIVIYKNHKFKSNLVKTGFVGCYKDQWARTLNRKKSTSRHMTFQKCRSICSHKKVNAKYFGLENGNECHCGDTLTRRVLKDEGECTKKCNGNHRQGCGGPWRLTVYRNSNYKKIHVSSGALLGCFIDQRDRVLRNGRTTSNNMTPDMCKKRCIKENKKFYGLEAGRECFCGNYLKRHKRRPKKECMDPCKGDRSKACGSGWRILIYKNVAYKSNIVKKDLVGCFKDQPARTLNIGKSHSSKMTIGKCRAICEKKNAKYYGLEVGKECHCGNYLSKYKKRHQSECKMPCGGNKKQGCGGRWRVLVYKNRKYKTNIVQKEYVGCYQDQRSRTLKDKKTVSSKMTVTMCRKTCITLKMKYYGLEATHECFCGNKLMKKVVKSDGECTHSCKGDKSQACGGPWRLAVYENPAFKHTAIVKKEYVGCYKDHAFRILKGKRTSSYSMTVDKCRKTCTDLKFKYYGVQATRQCFCGDKLTKITKKKDSECMKSCRGNREQACGGNWRMAVYQNPKYKPTAIVRKDYVGCYVDQRKRTFSKKLTISKTMTVEKCEKFCVKAGTKYYGLEYGKECFCGNKLSKKKADSDCSKPCTGDREQACGGTWRLAVYKNTKFGPPKKPPTICKDKKEVVQCSSSGGKRSVCIVPKAELVLNVDPKSLSSNCVAGKTYGRHGDEIWVSGKCGGKFDVCYREVVEEEVSNDCVKTADGSDYAGTWNKTKSGKSCQAWSSQNPHKHGFTHLPKNHCRNPDGEPHTWCYTTDPKTRWEFCDLPQCNTPKAGEAEECLTEPKGQNYEGTKSVTKSGIKCQAWSVKTPHSHSFSKRLSNQVNYCRNPDGEPKPWCYTTDKTKRWEFCDIPECAACDVEQEKGPDCKVIYKVSGSCHYESHYRNQCKYTVTLSKDGTGKLQADVKYGKTKFSLVKGKGVNKCAYFKIIGDYVVIEDTLSHGC
ncbi:uncharacterized protein LOC125650402 [Ostrea edulis]|uniref:uncharacterized protein LOC125650402 n=1 Tax=Ostrea edulis TaxID=37623 RepID=UPI0024AE8D7B|nr:uncharacterized protein LOC125650402 [Ostrea edulis]